ncbi:uncharacterized protein LACBIDRAFT_330324 [Laccaria bicolor S238N-H82]|uniref:Predicted protein n=1 Tax=Laccaria bicolor (strain S238N-H82 / ATCC MYA-4686) TaxID=486041 RepID=B0DKX8_LACBS|nr:uncharacterized protein LACBIDRAFT_330324 [Laccaria bicolor S238N-H82]EDR04725.1 predicted protein [Laccaria bicolor S238N-H82]|eukprot:XP_001884549.1 predicted protein [Laccaria bicolor S238N-H82]
MGADSLSEYSIDYRLRRCFATRSLANARMLGVFPDAQADDGADYWSIPSKRCHIAWETGFARGYALRVVATLRAIAVKVALVTRKLLAAAAITATLRTPPPPMVSNFTSRQRPLRRYAECHCHDHPDSSPQDAYTGGFHDYRFLCHPLAHGLPHDGLVWPRMVSGAMQETGAMQGLSPGILSWPFMALRGTRTFADDGELRILREPGLHHSSLSANKELCPALAPDQGRSSPLAFPSIPQDLYLVLIPPSSWRTDTSPRYAQLRPLFKGSTFARSLHEQLLHPPSKRLSKSLRK